MTDTVVLAAVVKTTLLEVAKQASGLGKGLLNVAPTASSGANNSVNYLLDVSDAIYKLAEECNAFIEEA